MSVTLDEAKRQLNIPIADTSDDLELTLYVDAANEWVASKVSDTSLASVKVATLIINDHAWETQRGPGSSPLDDDDLVRVPGLAFAIPNRAVQWLEPHFVTATSLGSFPDAVDWPDPVEYSGS